MAPPRLARPNHLRSTSRPKTIAETDSIGARRATRTELCAAHMDTLMRMESIDTLSMLPITTDSEPTSSRTSLDSLVKLSQLASSMQVVQLHRQQRRQTTRDIRRQQLPTMAIGAASPAAAHHRRWPRLPRLRLTSSRVTSQIVSVRQETSATRERHTI